MPNENDPAEGEISENQVNVARRKINLADALGADGWERGNWAGGGSSIIDTGSNGGVDYADLIGCGNT